jgi:hypothetical protein
MSGFLLDHILSLGDSQTFLKTFQQRRRNRLWGTTKPIIQINIPIQKRQISECHTKSNKTKNMIRG